MQAGITLPYLNMDAYKGRETEFNNLLMWLRDHWRAKVDPSNTGVEAKVSDLFEWIAKSDTYKGKGFLVEMRDGAGNPTGDQMLIAALYFPASGDFSYISRIWAGDSSTTNQQFFSLAGYQPSSGWLSSRQLHPLYVQEGGTWRAKYSGLMEGGAFSAGMEVRNAGDTKRGVVVEATATDWVIRQTKGVAFVADEDILDVAGPSTNYGTVTSVTWRSFFDLGFDDISTLSFASGDFTTLPVSPWSVFSDFIPKEGAGCTFRNLVWPLFTGAVDGGSSMRQCVFDNERNIFAFYNSQGTFAHFRDVYVCGEVFRNADDSNDYTRGSVGFRQIVDSNRFAYIESAFVQGQYSGVGSGVVGERAYFNLLWDSSITLYSAYADTLQPKFAERAIGVSNANEVKGHLKKEVLRIQGGYRSHPFLKTYRGAVGENTGLKINEYLVVPWADNVGFVPLIPDYSFGETTHPPFDAL
ncbi:MAG: hypothetical protein H6727_09330 [Myxococcales bacterium]|nr:hypothetical protein [Myxococcales bacterium]